MSIPDAREPFLFSTLLAIEQMWRTAGADTRMPKGWADGGREGWRERWRDRGMEEGKEGERKGRIEGWREGWRES